MALRIVEESADALADYARVSLAFRVESRLRIEQISSGVGGFRLLQEPVELPYVKDYDRISGEGPSTWSKRWDISSWGILSAFRGSDRVGGAAVAWNTPAIDLLEGRRDLAVLWDLRVSPEQRGRGIGRELFSSSAGWARRRGCRSLKIETQDTNVAACRFYAGRGCVLRAVSAGAYPELPHETQLLWYLDL